MRWSSDLEGSGPRTREVRSLWATVAGAALLALALQGTALAQADTGGGGRIAGTARDSSGLVLPGASVSALNSRTGEATEATSNAQGHFVIAALRPSSYTVTARLAGFAPVEFKNVQLLAGQEMTLDVTLAVANKSETVTVTS